MSVTVRNPAGYTSNIDTSVGGRQAFTLSNGNALVVIRDANVSGASGGDGTGVAKLYVYESSDRSTFTLRATVAAPAGGIYRISCGLFPDDSIGIAASSTDQGTLYYTKVTYSTWAVAAWATVAVATTDLSTSLFRRFDICVTDTSIPIICAYQSATGAKYMSMMVRRTSDSTWIKTNSTNSVAQNSYSVGGAAISICAPVGTATSRGVVVAMADSNPGTEADYGVKLYTAFVNESTGAITSITARATYAQGEALGSGTSTRTIEGRQVKLFNTGSAGEYTLGIMHNEVNRRFFIVRGNLDAAGNWTTVIPLGYSYTGYSPASLSERGMGMTAGNDSLTFHFSVLNGNDTGRRQIASYTVRLDRVAKSLSFAPSRGWWNDALPTTGDTMQIWGGGDRNFSIARHDTLLFIYGSSTSVFYSHTYAGGAGRAPTNSVPAAGATMTDSTPALLARADTNRALKQSRIKIHWQFAKDSIFTTNLVDYLEADSKFKDVVGTNVTGVDVAFNDELPAASALTQGTWFMRSAMYDEMDQQGSWSTNTSFTVTHPPAATSQSPSGGSIYSYGTTGNKTFSWKFTDPSPTDVQTAYQIIVSRNDTGATVLDTNKVTSTALSTTLTIPSTYKDLLLQWKIRLYDSDDVAGSYSANATFQMSDPPTVTILSPTSVTVVTSGVPSVQSQVTLGGTRTVKSYTVTISQGNTTVWTTTATNQSIASGSTWTVTGKQSVLSNNTSYTVNVSVTDSTGLTAKATPVTFFTTWITPAAPSGVTVNNVQYNVEDQGYVTVSWADTGRDADFAGWVIYRRENILTADGTVISFGDWHPIYTEYTANTSGYVYEDYTAYNGYRNDYRVTQAVNRFGDIIESNNTDYYSTVPTSDGYWLISPATATTDATAFKLSIVVSDSYTDEYESETYNVIGRGRHVDVGERLGKNGSVDAQLRDSPTKTARQKKLSIETLKEQKIAVYMRNPFGDTFLVSLGDVQVSRVAGVGSAEFCDVTIPYSEVGV